MTATAKTRFEWIDNARVIAAFLVMYIHLSGRASTLGNPEVASYVSYFSHCFFMDAAVPFFLILAGYFLARNITWAKAGKRFISLFIPLVLWNLIVAAAWGKLPTGPVSFLTDILGINTLVVKQIVLFPHAESIPIDVPSWFLREIAFLTLLTPLFVRLHRILPLILVIYPSFLFFNHTPNAYYVFAPSTVFFYLLGVSLRKFPVEAAYTILQPRFTWIMIAALGFALCFLTLNFMTIEPPRPMTTSIFGIVVGALCLANCGLLIERHLPRFSKYLSQCGPACFLVFMLHYPIFISLKKLLPTEVWNTEWTLLVPFPTFVIIVAFYFAMKKWLPWLMPYLANTRMPKKPAN